MVPTSNRLLQEISLPLGLAPLLAPERLEGLLRDKEGKEVGDGSPLAAYELTQASAAASGGLELSALERVVNGLVPETFQWMRDNKARLPVLVRR